MPSPRRRPGRRTTTAMPPGHRRVRSRQCLRPAKMAAARAGVIVIAFTAEMTIDTAIVSANWRKNCPLMPPRNALGKNTAPRTSVIAMIGPVISSIALIVASRTFSPLASQRSMFSSTTIASSTTMPMASTRPKSVRLLIVKPISFMTAKVPISDTATSMSGSSTAFQSCKKTSTTMATKNDGVAQRVEDLAHRFLDEQRRVVNDGVFQLVGKAPLQVAHLRHAGVRRFPGRWRSAVGRWPDRRTACRRAGTSCPGCGRRVPTGSRRAGTSPARRRRSSRRCCRNVWAPLRRP